MPELPKMIFMSDDNSPHMHFEKVLHFYEKVIITDVFIKNPETGTLCLVPALWDTGATNTGIRAETAKQLNLKYIGQKDNMTADLRVNTYDVYLTSVSDKANGYYINVKSIAIPTPVEYSVIIGMDIISQGTFKLVKKGTDLLFTFDI